MQHRCGGTLQPHQVKIKKKIGYYFQNFTVNGYKCDYCSEEVISRDIAFEIDKTVEQFRQIWRDWRIPSYSGRPTGTFVSESLFEDSTNVSSTYL